MVTGTDQAGKKITARAAAQLLAARDPMIARLVAQASPPSFPRPADSNFAALVRAITYQQLAGNAARAIHGRLVAAMDGQVSAERLLALSDDELRAAGLSRGKVLSLRDLAAKVLDGTVVLDPRLIARKSDAEVTVQLTSVRGIGKWTADVFLLFQLRRLDVWPTGDLAIRRGYGLGWQVPTPTARQLDLLGEPYRPYRSVVAWYCWQAAELYGKSQLVLPAEPAIGNAVTLRAAGPAKRRTAGRSSRRASAQTVPVPSTAPPIVSVK
jgi:DNA-3-methyladenine glycosylase II